ncbi:DoxX family membrane protein [Aeromicrobium sp. SMF47]|uniref:DoxX family membrane protein n=1 Tax=Aeromicrobium yanjiei TaxID=2662028 RepID=A0A5Q2MG65_9ACTN|nr:MULTISPECIES: DoxX family protein [Aeromicrobium]MRJ78268.1 DoxX family membrane protein [Aeromicrobium yanjiei]MRK03102.1 DoxX family membrane protein [Aeromicrobium sp. S22]QGG40671.1 DoxX family membrane protein [Aeromicrobium yanjiei]
MTLLRSVARPMLASMFVYGGAQALKQPGARAAKAQRLADLIKKVAPQVPVNGANLTRVNGAVQLTAGLGLATGHLPRLSAFVLAVTLPPTTVAGHRYWDETDPAARTNQRIHFMKNMALTGGLLMATLDPDPHKKILARRAKDKMSVAAASVADQLDHIRS